VKDDLTSTNGEISWTIGEWILEMIDQNFEDAVDK
jgi:hypothetical protein